MMTFFDESRTVRHTRSPDRWPGGAYQRVSGLKNRRLTVSFDPQMREALKALAQRMERSEGWAVGLAVKRLPDHASKDQAQLEFDLQREKQLE